MNPFRFGAIILIRAYRLFLSPLKNLLFGPNAGCRFSPSCSAYALQAFQIHGVFRAASLTLGRILRCHPWGGCGYDPVPANPKRCGC